MEQIRNIPIEQLAHHPKNPRLDLGDLTELANSIAARGVMQNLTVVPIPDQQEGQTEKYWVVIGNRRMEASKMTMLAELPCVVVDMDEKEQLSTMLLENMQRSDLTVFEQAKGFQMMMDLGITPEEIADKTGFSETTVRRRVKLCQFDKDQFKDGCDRGATLMDWMEIDKIQSPKLKAKAIEAIGTGNFKWTVQNAINQEETDVWVKGVVEKIKPWAKPLKLANGENRYTHFREVGYYNHYNRDKEVIIPDDTQTTEYFYKAERGVVHVYIRKEDVSVEDNSEQIERERVRMEELSKVSEQAYQLRSSFVKEFQGAKKHLSILMEYILNVWTSGWMSGHVDRRYLCEILGVQLSEEQKSLPNVNELLDGMSLEKKILACIPCGAVFYDSKNKHYYYGNGVYSRDSDLDKYYDLLIALGYPMSDEEHSMRDGTHPLLVKDEDGDEDDENEDDDDTEEDED